MPLQTASPLGALGSLLSSLGDRASDLELNRFKPGGAAPAASYSTSSSSWQYPSVWPAVEVNIRPSGCLIVYLVGWVSTVVPAGSSTYNPQFQIGVVVDGAVPALIFSQVETISEIGSSYTQWYDFFGVLPMVGLSEGVHSLDLAVASDGSTTWTFSQMMFAGQPL